MNTYYKPTRWLMALGLAGVTILAGCAKKPADCSDSQTVKTINSILVDNVNALMPKFTNNQAQDDPQKIQEGYFQGLKSELLNVVSDGYSEQAKKNECRGKLSVSAVSGETFSRDILYSTQLIEDKSGESLVEVQEFQPLLMAVAADLTYYYYAKRYKGEWKGDYSCAGIEDAKDGPQGPFSMPVTMVVDEHRQATLERTTKGGGVERLKGQAGQNLYLAGEGKNSPDDTWKTTFQGQVQGLDYAAQGQIVTADNRLLRQCSLKLKLPSN